MATTKIRLGNAIGSNIIEDLDADATAENDVNGGAATIHEIYVDNSANTAASSYVKLYDNAAPTVGTTAPNFVVRARLARKIRVYTSPGLGHATTNLSIAGLNAGGTAGTTGPTSDVIVRVRIS